MKLETLLGQYKLLETKGRTVREKAQRGLAFEKLLSELFRTQGLPMSDPFRIVGEQVDGAFEYKGWTYLVEAKWQNKKKSAEALFSFQGKVDRRLEGTRGVFISTSGFYRTAVDSFKRGRKPNVLLWTGEHIRAVLDGLVTIPELIDLCIRFAAERSEVLVSPEELMSSQDRPLFAAALQACAEQVDAEISVFVGKKYIPKLYVDRDIHDQLDTLVQPHVYIALLLSELKRLRELEKQERRQKQRGSSRLTSLISLIEEAGTGLFGVRRIMDSLRPLKRTSISDYDILCRLVDDLPEELFGRMHVITARAGAGKTNLLCHMAKHYVRQLPTIFLTARSGITPTTSIKELVESKLARFLGVPLAREHLFGRIISLAKRRKTSLLIFLDAMNEHHDLDFLSTAIADFLLEIRGAPVTVVASCRDVYWPFFDVSKWPTTQWSRVRMRLDTYSSPEFEKATIAYFDYYNIEASLSEDAKNKLAHPLILRFFCEAYGDPCSHKQVKLGGVADIRLEVLFDDYLARKIESIRHTAPRRRRTSREIEDYLFSLANRMRHTKARDVGLNDVSVVTGCNDLESPESVHVAILGEDIILEEEPDHQTGRVNVLFTYDEFMEYMIARSMLRALHPVKLATAKPLAKECQNCVDAFPSFLGVFEYLSIMLREDHEVAIWDAVDVNVDKFAAAVCRAIGKLGLGFFGASEGRILAKLLVSPTREQRAQAVQLLTLIVLDERQTNSSRARAADLLPRVLAREEDLLIRSDAVRCFENEEVSRLSSEARSIAWWWTAKKEQAKRRRVLCCDDDQMTLRAFGEYLGISGFRRIYLEADRPHAIQLARRIRPALILMGINDFNPDTAISELSKAVKADAGTAKIPMLLLSASPIKKKRDKRVFVACFEKPTGPQTLLRAIQMALAGKLRRRRKRSA